MGKYRFVIKERALNGTLWTSEILEGDYREVCQNVTAGYQNCTRGTVRWAETSADSENPFFFLYGINRTGKPSQCGGPDFQE